jgi:c-di-GMP-binding flagellar brake protein YcgR
MTDRLNLPLKRPSSSDQVITSLTQKAQVLRRLLDGRCSLSVSIGGKRDIFLSTILSVNRRESTLDIDALNPTIEHGILLASSGLNISCKLEGVSVNFSTNISKIQTMEGTDYYVLAFPERIYYGQQREHYRIYISMLRRPAIQLELDNHIISDGEVANISQGGVLAVLPPDVEIKSGNRVPNCNIKFGDREGFTTTVEICHQRTHPKTGQIEVGLLFLDLNKAQKKLLRRHATQIERQNARSS